MQHVEEAPGTAAAEAEAEIEFQLWHLDGSHASLRINRFASLRQFKNKLRDCATQPCFTLVPSRGPLLEPEEILAETDWKDGLDLQVVTHRPHLAVTQNAVYAWSQDDDRLAVWGQHGPPRILQSPFFWRATACQTNADACAMITRLGEIACVGVTSCGGDGPDASQQGVARYIQATDKAFAAILDTGNVIAWGDPLMGGDCSQMQHELTDVIAVQRTSQAFAALRADGCVITWGHPAAGGCSAKVRTLLRNIQNLQGNNTAFAAITEDDTVVCWGNPADGGEQAAVASQLQGVHKIQATSAAFAAILHDMTVITWGCRYSGGDSSRVRSLLRQITKIQSSHSAFAALRSDGRIVAWGNHVTGGTLPDAWKNREAKAIQGNKSGFAALLRDCSIITWGHVQATHEAEIQLGQPFHCIAATAHAFAGLTKQGRIVAWGAPEHGGDASAVQDSVSAVRELAATSAAFVAVTEAGKIIAWGDEARGGACHELTTFFLS
eukprot:s2414_g7.t1